MTRRSKTTISGVILDRKASFTLSEICRACGADRSVVIEMVEEGVLDARGQPPDLRFHGDELVRARRAMRLLRDLEVNMAGAALALDLLDELERLKAQLPAER